MKNLISTLLCLFLTSYLIGQVKYIHCGSLIDVESKEILKKRTIIIDGNKIQDVVKGYQSPPRDAELIDLTEMTVMPGFMDMHVHIEHESRPKSYEEKFRLDDSDVALEANLLQPQVDTPTQQMV